MTTTSDDGNWTVTEAGDPMPDWLTAMRSVCVKCGARVEDAQLATHVAWHAGNPAA